MYIDRGKHVFQFPIHSERTFFICDFISSDFSRTAWISSVDRKVDEDDILAR